MKWRTFAAGLVLAMPLLIPNQANAVIARGGEACFKENAVQAGMKCVSTRGKLTWSLNRKSQRIIYRAPVHVSDADLSVKLTYHATSGLHVAAKSLTPNVCIFRHTLLLIVGTPGNCQLVLNQSGDITYAPAPPIQIKVLVLGINHIDFRLPGALRPGSGPYTLQASSPSHKPITFSSDTPTVCQVNKSELSFLKLGACTITARQEASDLYPAAKPVRATVDIESSRVDAELPDAIDGFQVKAIYVVPSDGTDHAYDTNGVIESVLDEGTKYLQSELQRTIPIDSTASGYDIGFLKSKMDSEYFKSNQGLYVSLLKESKLLESPSSNRKNYIFFVDTDTIISPMYCGEAPQPGMSAVVAIGDSMCGRKTTFFKNMASQTWVHELFHNLGVSHVPEPCDLMFSGDEADGELCQADKPLTIDRGHTMYYGVHKYGEDILHIRVWKGQTSDKNLIADCIVSPTDSPLPSDGKAYAYCPTGTQTIGSASFCWTVIDSAKLEELVDGKWVVVGIGGRANRPWGVSIDRHCHFSNYVGPRTEVTVNEPGVRHYRWIVNGQISEYLNIIWAQ